MNKNIMIVLGGAIAVAVLVAMLVQISIGGKKHEAVQEAKAEILVAAKDLHLGDELGAGSLRWQAWPKESIFPGAITQDDPKMDADKALSGRLARNIAKGEPVMKSAMIGVGKGNVVADTLDPGMRAVAIEVSASSMVGGFAGPGDFVDVILNYKISFKTEDKDPNVKNMIDMNISKSATETILQNIKVLAVDQTAKRGDEDKVKVAKTVTLEVTPQDAEKLAQAASMGDLTLTLRPIGDKAAVVKTWQTTSDARMVNLNKEIFTEYVKMEKDAGIHPNIVRIYNGDAVDQSLTRPAPSQPSGGQAP